MKLGYGASPKEKAEAQMVVELVAGGALREAAATLPDGEDPTIEGVDLIFLFDEDVRFTDIFRYDNGEAAELMGLYYALSRRTASLSGFTQMMVFDPFTGQLLAEVDFEELPVSFAPYIATRPNLELT